MKAKRLLLTAAIGGLWTAACSSDPPAGTLEQTVCNCDVEVPPCCCTSPILIDVAGDGFRVTSWVDGVEFSPSRGFRPSDRAWTEANSDDAWLVLDRNGDGVINDGSEMFGNATPQPPPSDGTLRNGFLALAQYDDDRNDTLDARDPVFSELRLWQDMDHDGVSQPIEMHTLPELGVAGLSLAYTEAREADQHGNSFRYKAAVYGTPGSSVGVTAWDVWLTGIRPEPVGRFRDGDLGNPREHKRCYRATDGDYDTWIEYCKTVPRNIRASCYEQGHQSKQSKRGWCDNYWGSIITCTE